MNGVYMLGGLKTIILYAAVRFLFILFANGNQTIHSRKQLIDRDAFGLGPLLCVRSCLLRNKIEAHLMVRDVEK